MNLKENLLFRKMFFHFLKFGFIFMLCAVSFSVSAQTAVQTKIAGAKINEKIQIGTRSWFVVKKTKIDNADYAFLISTPHIDGPQLFSSIGTDYQGSNLQSQINSIYKTQSSYFKELYPIAVVPDLGIFSSQTAISIPTTEMAEGSGKTDILFAPSFQDVEDWAGDSSPLLLKDPVNQTNYPMIWWTRTPYIAPNSVWVVNTSGPFFTASHYAAEFKIYVVVGIWVRVTPIYEPGFKVNEIDYEDVKGKWFCSDTEFTLQANDANLQKITWKVNGVENTKDAITVNIGKLDDGEHEISMYLYGNEYSTTINVGNFPVIWQGKDNDWNDPKNWKPAIVPSSCNDVYIPGNLENYPQLSKKNRGKCRNIYFMYGSQLARPDLLTYKRAFVQYNFGLSKGNQQQINNDALVLNSSESDDRALYSAAVSAPPIPREKWFMLSSPLRKVVTGDFSFGGFPLTFLRKFDAVKQDNQNYSVGNWTTSYTNMNEEVAKQPTDGFAFYMYGFRATESDNQGCYESGKYGDLNELEFFNDRVGKRYGINKINGILELPFYEDYTNLLAHRNQGYDSDANRSTFYYFYDGKNNHGLCNAFTGETEDVVREDNKGNYRFAPEIYEEEKKEWSFPAKTYHITDAEKDAEFLVGNPFMSLIDMHDFLNNKNNKNNIYDSYRIWDGDDFISAKLIENDIVTLDGKSKMRYVNPQQGFFLKAKESGRNINIEFDVEEISKVREQPSESRNVEENKEENLLRIKAENDRSAAYTVIGYIEGATADYKSGEDVGKLFSPLSYVPSIYSLAGDMPVDFNFINNSGEIIIPLGIRTKRKGEINLTFTGMDNYTKASKIEFIDALDNKTIDITGKTSYNYSFNHNETGISNGRFSIKISHSITSLEDVYSKNELKIYGASEGIYVVSSEAVQKLEVFDFSGKKIYETTSDAKYYPLQGYSGDTPLIVRVMTNSGVKTVKIN